jgi:hypothetical protein
VKNSAITMKFRIVPEDGEAKNFLALNGVAAMLSLYYNTSIATVYPTDGSVSVIMRRA